MRLTKIGSNKTELHTGSVTILYSYDTPVAASNWSTGERFRTEKKHSVTTTKHINSWLKGEFAHPMPQEFFDNMVESR